MPIKRIERTAYFVKDWDSSVSLYRDILGLKLLVIVPASGRTLRRQANRASTSKAEWQQAGPRFGEC